MATRVGDWDADKLERAEQLAASRHHWLTHGASVLAAAEAARLFLYRWTHPATSALGRLIEFLELRR